MAIQITTPAPGTAGVPYAGENITVAGLNAALNSRTTAPNIVHVYPGAEHGFSARTRHGNPINKAATDLSRPQVVAFIQATTRA